MKKVIVKIVALITAFAVLGNGMIYGYEYGETESGFFAVALDSVNESLEYFIDEYIPGDMSELPDDNALEGMYIERLFYGEGASTYKDYGMSVLEGRQLDLYMFLKEHIEKVAAGEISSTVFDYNFTNPVLKDQAEADVFTAALYQDLNISVKHLMSDLPADFYWYDKTMGHGYSAGIKMGGIRDGITDFTLTVSFSVSSDYAADSKYTVDTAKMDKARKAVSNALEIVEKYEGLSQKKRILGYASEICALVKYNHEAVDNDNIPYGDPWQLVYVFDGDSETNVVCEGYSKAFQYLCDLSGIECYTVHSDTHMWNIVLWCGIPYHMDITNCDESETPGFQTIGYPDKLLLKPAVSSSGMGCTLKIGTTSTQSYVYSANTVLLYPESILAVTTEPTDPTETVMYISEESSEIYIGETSEFTVTVKDIDTDSEFYDGELAVFSSSEDIASVSVSENNIVTVEGKGSGKATVTCKFTPARGSVSQAIYTVNVNCPHVEKENEWHSDAENHWKTCSVCGEALEKEPHMPGAEATEESPQLCTVCGYEIASALPHVHTFDGEWQSDGENHWKICTVCGEESEKESHIPGAEATEESPQLCTVCGYEIAPALPHVHTFSSEWTYDDDCHWHEAICGHTDLKSDMGHHIFDDGKVIIEPTKEHDGEKLYTCAICEKTRSEAIKYVPSDTEPSVPTEPEPSIPTEPSVPTEPEPSIPTEPSVPTEPEPSIPTEPSVPTEPGPSIPTEPSVPTEPEPSIPTEPSVPTEPEPSIPTEPSVPTEPEPSIPTEPSVPTEPEPSIPTEPSVPTEPEPSIPTEPSVPTEPEPSIPTEPSVPTEPEPSIPTEPEPPITTAPITYTFYSDGSVTIIGIHTDSHAFIIPDEIEGKPVKAITADSFAGASGLTVIYIPESVDMIEGNPFDSCPRLTDIFYGGSENKWYVAASGIPFENGILSNVTLHFNVKGLSADIPTATANKEDIEAAVVFSAYGEAPTVYIGGDHAAISDDGLKVVSELTVPIIFKTNNFTLIIRPGAVITPADFDIIVRAAENGDNIGQWANIENSLMIVPVKPGEGDFGMTVELVIPKSSLPASVNSRPYFYHIDGNGNIEDYGESLNYSAESGDVSVILSHASRYLLTPSPISTDTDSGTGNGSAAESVPLAVTLPAGSFMVPETASSASAAASAAQTSDSVPQITESFADTTVPPVAFDTALPPPAVTDTAAMEAVTSVFDEVQGGAEQNGKVISSAVTASAGNTESERGVYEDKNVNTGVTLSFSPLVMAASAAIVFKKKKIKVKK